MAFPPRGGCAEMLGVGPGEGGIAAETRLETAFRCGHALPNQILGMNQTAFLQISVDGLTGFLSEQAHHVEFADVKLFRQGIHTDIFRQVGIHVAQDVQNTAVGGGEGLCKGGFRVSDGAGDFD